MGHYVLVFPAAAFFIKENNVCSIVPQRQFFKGISTSLPAFFNLSLSFKQRSSGGINCVIGTCEKEQVFSDQLLNGRSLQCLQKNRLSW